MQGEPREIISRNTLGQTRNSLSWRARLFRIILGWTDHPKAGRVLFSLAIIQSACLPVPVAMVFLAMSVVSPENAFRFATICTFGSVIGGVLAYGIGYTGWSALKELFIPYVFSQEVLTRVETIYQNNIFVALLMAAFTPVPYQICAIAAGILKVNLGAFVLASLIARLIRFFLLATLVHFLGERATHFVQNHLRLVLWIIFLVLVVYGIVGHM